MVERLDPLTEKTQHIKKLVKEYTNEDRDRADVQIFHNIPRRYLSCLTPR